MRLFRFALAVSLLGCAAVSAQDTRTVTEPHVPAVCVRLQAQLHSAGGAFSDADEVKLDTARIQAALDRCTGRGEAVELARGAVGNAFLSGPLELHPRVTLLVDRGVTLYGSRDPKVYAVSPGSCGIVNNERAGCRPLIHGENAAHAGIMGDGIIDGRGGAHLLGQDLSWWDLANQARSGGRQQVPRLIETNRCDDFTLYRITLKNSANFHVWYGHGDGFTVWGLKIDTPKDARNTDGVDPSASTNITVTQSYIRTGDDNIAIKGGTGPVTNMSVIDNHFFYGHGMSIGSETNAGVSHIVVHHLTLDGTTAGIRIKSNSTRGGLVDDVIYKGLCIRDSEHPIQLDTNYSYAGDQVNSFPVFQHIHIEDVQIFRSKTISLVGYDHTHRVGVQLDGVLLDHPETYTFDVKHADIVYGPGPVNFTFQGEDTTVTGKAGAGALPSCEKAFVPFPVTH